MIIKVMGPEMGEYWLWDGIDKIQICPIKEKPLMETENSLFVDQFVKGQRGIRTHITKGELENKVKEQQQNKTLSGLKVEVVKAMGSIVAQEVAGVMANLHTQPKIFKVIGSIFENGKPSLGYSINYQDKNQDWCTILFNTTAYICGDDGKTIEVVHG